jgi:hypothetical protein
VKATPLQLNAFPTPFASYKIINYIPVRQPSY